jgi:FKBP-type peptidyl-prolyl cis-trans isomerase
MLLRTRIGRTMAASVAASAMAGFAPAHAEAPDPVMTGSELGGALQEEAKKVRPTALSIRELHVGDGATAKTGDWVSVHYNVQLVGDGSIVEDTRTSGFGDRDYGHCCMFELGDLGNESVLRVLHAAALDMRVGGRRRVRTSVLEPSFGYRDEPPPLYESRGGRRVPRKLHGDWLMDVEVTLEAVSAERPPGALQARVRSFLGL